MCRPLLPSCPENDVVAKRRRLNLRERGCLAAFASLQNALVGGLIYGWASIDRTMLVASTEQGGAALTPMQTTQIFSMASSVAMCSSIVMGLILDKFGPRMCSVLAHFLIGTGCQLFSMAQRFEVFALATCCMAFGGPGIYYSIVHIAYLFPRNQFLVMSCLGGSVTLSFSVLSYFGDLWESLHIDFRALFGGFVLIIGASTVGAICLWPDTPFEAGDSDESYNRLSPTECDDEGIEACAQDSVADEGTKGSRPPPTITAEHEYLEATLSHHQLMEEPLDSGLRRKLTYGRTESYFQSAEAIQSGNPSEASLKDQPFQDQLFSPTYLKSLLIVIVNSFFANFTIASLSTELADQQKFPLAMQHDLSRSFTHIMSCGLVGSILVGSLMDRIGLEWCTMLTLLLGQASLALFIFCRTYSVMFFGFVFYTLFRQFMFPVFVAGLTARLGFKYFGMLSGIGFTLSGLAQMWMAYLVDWLQGDCHLQRDVEYGSIPCNQGSWMIFHVFQFCLLSALLFIPIADKQSLYRKKWRNLSSYNPSMNSTEGKPFLRMSLTAESDGIEAGSEYSLKASPAERGARAPVYGSTEDKLPST